jgi:F-type H+-transporting ATPase subunit b
MSELSSRLFAAALLLLQPAVLLASAEGEHHGMPTPLKLAVMTINLGIFFYLLKKTAWPVLVESVASRRDDVVEALEKAATAKREAEALKAEWTDKLASLDREIGQMRDQAQKQIAAERDQILEATKNLVASIRRDAEKAAQQDLRNARELLRAEVAEQAYRIACEAAPSQLGAGDQKRFVDEFLAQVSK